MDFEKAEKVKDILRKIEDVKREIANIRNASKYTMYLKTEPMAGIMIPDALHDTIVKLMLAEKQYKLSELENELKAL